MTSGAPVQSPDHGFDALLNNIDVITVPLLLQLSCIMDLEFEGSDHLLVLGMQITSRMRWEIERYKRKSESPSNNCFHYGK
jgi:hypothetical protein